MDGPQMYLYDRNMVATTNLKYALIIELLSQNDGTKKFQISESKISKKISHFRGPKCRVEAT